MPKTKISEFSATPGNNTDIDGINIAEGCAPSGINDAIRELMAQLKDFQAGTAGDSFNGPVGTSTAAAGAFTTLSSTGNTTLGDASGDAVTINGATTFVNVSPTITPGTANGVAYLNGSKVLTTGSALTFDGSKLVASGGNEAIRIASGAPYYSFYNAAQTTQYGYIQHTGTDLALVNVQNGAMPFYVNNAEQMRLTSTGLGIGTSSPNYSLTSYKGGAVANYLQVASGATGAGSLNGLLLGVDASGNGVINAQGGGVNLYTYVAGLLRTTIDSSGNLGLGVTPSAWSGFGKTMEFNNAGCYVGNSGATSMQVGANNYFNGSNYVYSTSNVATRYAQASGQHIWFTAPSGTAGNAITFTQAMTLDASGNLGVGSTSPSARLEVKTTSSSTDVDIRNSTTLNRITASGGDLLIRADYENSTANSTIQFSVDGTERARITSGGVLLVGTTSAPSIAGVTTDHAFVAGTGNRWVSGFRNTTTGTPWGLVVEYSGAAPNDTSSNFLYCVDNAAGTTLRMNVRSNGGIANYSANDVNLSDRREKTNLAPAKSYLDTICAIPVQTFNYIDQSENDPGLTLGVVAQDVQAVAPELVMESNWGTEDNPKMRLSIYQTDLQYALMKALQELKAEFDAYKATHP
jgi:hypothetical protein